MNENNLPAKQEEGGMNFFDRKYPSLLVALMILFSVFTYSLETFEGLPKSVINMIDWSEYVIVAFFTVEYLSRLFSAENKMQFATSFYGVVDLLVILPFYLALAMDLRALRLVRMLRLLRVFKFARYNAALSRLGLALRMAKEELVVSIAAILMVIYFAAFGIYQFEHLVQPDKFRNILDALWWSVATVTTVGYGDVYPVTLAGRAFTFVVLLAGLGLVAIPSGILASALFAVKVASAQEDGTNKSLNEN